jgi:phosphoribosylformimino-5-aminoimidazole carboxamide ribotide isomerase
MGGKIVQLVQGEKKALEFDDFDDWVERFSSYPLVQLIDLDAAMGTGENRALITEFCRKLPCQVGGGIRNADDAQRVFDAGARRAIFGSSLIKNGAINTVFAASLSRQFGPERIVAAIDSRGGHVAIQGWKTVTRITPAEMMAALEPYCAAFLYTHVDTEGTLQGIPLDVIRNLQSLTNRKLIAAGGIRSQPEIDKLNALGVDAVVGMAVYTGLINV